MARYQSKLVQAALALALLIASFMFWPSLGTTPTYLTPSAAFAACPTPSNSACLAASPSVGTTLNGTDQTVPYSILFTLNNTVMASWHVTIALTQFTTVSTPHRTLPTNSTITGVTVLSSCTSTCPSNGIAYPLTVTAGSSAITFYDNMQSGNSDHGVDTFTLQAATNVSVPANSYAGTYTSTITIAFVSGSP